MHEGRADPRIALLASDFPPNPGGIQRYLYELARALSRAGARVVVVSSVLGSKRTESARRMLGCPLIETSLPRGLGRYRFLAFTAVLRHLLSRLPLSVVLAGQTLPEGLAAMLATRARRCPVAVVGYGDEFAPVRRLAVGNLAKRWVLRGADVWFPISRYTADLLRREGVAADRIEVIGAGVDTRKFLDADLAGRQLRSRLGLADSKVVLTVGRLDPRKGHDIIIRALPEILRAVPNVVYVVVGDGGMRAPLEALADEVGVGSRVHFAGSAPEEELAAYYGACDLFAMPSRDIPHQPPEGFGLVYLEAALAGKAVVGTWHGGVPDAVVHGKTGLLVPQHDPRAFARATVSLLLRPDAAARMGERGRRRAQRFTWDRVAQRTLSALEERGLL